MSSLPNALIVRETILRQASGTLTSALTAIARPPAEAMVSTARRALLCDQL